MTGETAIKAFEAFERIQGDYIWSEYGATRVGQMLQAEMASVGLVIVELDTLEDLRKTLALALQRS